MPLFAVSSTEIGRRAMLSIDSGAQLSQYAGSSAEQRADEMFANASAKVSQLKATAEARVV